MGFERRALDHLLEVQAEGRIVPGQNIVGGAQEPCEQFGFLIILGPLHGAQRRKKRADRVFEHRAEESLAYYAACAYARAGKFERALACLDATIKAVWSHGRWLEADTDLDSLRNEPAFEKLQERLA